MTDVLKSYLLQHKSLNIPGLGSIYIQKKPGATDFVNRQLFPASYSYRFDKYFDSPDKRFFNYLAQKKGIADYEAIQWYNSFAFDLREQIKTDGYYEWPGIGVFKKDTNGDVIFEEHSQSLPTFAPVPARRIIRKDASHAILVGDKEKTNLQMSELLHEQVEQPVVVKSRWWITALILALIAILLLFFHFYTTGFTWGSTGNQQTVSPVPAPAAAN